MNLVEALFNSLLLILIIEVALKLGVKKLLANYNNKLKISLVIGIALIYAWFTAENGVFNRKENLYEILGFDPYSPSEIIAESIDLYNNRLGTSTKQFDLLKQKNYQDEYYKYGTMTISIKKDEIDQRNIRCFIPFIFYLIISRVYLDDEMKMSKRVWSIFSILGGLYQVGLFAAVNPRDIIIEMFPVRMALFEIVQIFNFIFVLFFLIIIGVDLILTETKEKIVDPENLTLFQIIAQNQKIIQERVEILDNKRKAKFEEPPESISENQ